jgi:central kinetochore subunit Mis15/CHL4
LYVTQHKELSLVVMRIQIFEPKSQSVAMGNLTELRPFFVAFPMSSPHILHGATETVYSSSVLSSIASVVSKPGKPVSLKISTEMPSRSLTAFSVLKGVSRHASSLGAWSIYAEGVVDSSPLNPYPQLPQKHDPEHLEPETKRRRIANLLFTGRPDDPPDDQYKSRVQLPMVEFKLQEKYDDDFRPSITIRLEGDDVFAGVYKLAVKGSIDVQRLPSWLTGEDGLTSAVIQERQVVND